VEYLPAQELIALVASSGADLTFDSTGLGQAKCLMIKRIEFRHEGEVRLLYSKIDIASAVDDYVPFDFDSSRLVEDVVLDPRLSPAACDQYSAEIRASGYAGPLRQSDLYKVPSFPVLNIDA
jgi:hypothetical protein